MKKIIERQKKYPKLAIISSMTGLPIDKITEQQAANMEAELQKRESLNADSDDKSTSHPTDSNSPD